MGLKRRYVLRHLRLQGAEGHLNSRRQQCVRLCASGASRPQQWSRYALEHARQRHPCTRERRVEWCISAARRTWPAILIPPLLLNSVRDSAALAVPRRAWSRSLVALRPRQQLCKVRAQLHQSRWEVSRYAVPAGSFFVLRELLEAAVPSHGLSCAFDVRLFSRRCWDGVDLGDAPLDVR